jgi:alpha-D-ribose 1-methylphosphonate 5-triphosphate diphosphatase
MHRTTLSGGTVLLANGTLAPNDLVFEDDRIVAVAAGAALENSGSRIDVAGRYVLPGIVDIHGDAFERQLMPRPGVAVRHDIALLDTDRQLVANGITTAFHGVTVSWEPGLRSHAACRAMIATIAALDGRLACDTRLHLRFETHWLDALDEVEDWIGAKAVDLLAFNDHTPEIHRKRNDAHAALKYVERTALEPAAFRRLVEHVYARKDEVPAAVARIAAAGRAAGVPMLSHDDDCPATRSYYDGLGATIAEFPKTPAIAASARALANPVVMGAPNVMRGGSHIKAASASALVAEGLCTVLASDYYYPSLLQAAFRLAHDRVTEFGDAWNLIARNAADAVGLTDRGVLTPERRADIVVVDASVAALPRVVATFVAGQLAFAGSPQFTA